MIINEFKYKIHHLLSDFKGGLAVFFVAIPLCLGIAMACKMPLQSGLISGVSGGIVTGVMSGSHTSISGPSAGFVTVILDALHAMHSYDMLLFAIILSGVVQILFGIFGLGRFGAYIPTSVVNGLLFAIGFILIIKQIPHLVGYDSLPTGDFTFFVSNKSNAFYDIVYAFDHLDLGCLSIGLFSLLILFCYEKFNFKFKKHIPIYLVVVLFGIFLAYIFSVQKYHPKLPIQEDKIVSISNNTSGINNLSNIFHIPSVRNIKTFDDKLLVLKFALIIAIVTSIEAILGVTSGDKIDKQKRHTPLNRELVAQGLGNIISGSLGGLPITSVVVRTSVSIDNGSVTKLATIFHGLILLFSIIFIPFLINLIPLASLAAILIFSGIKIILSTKIHSIYKNGTTYFYPFIATTLFIIMTNVLIGVGIGLFIGIFFIVRANYSKKFTAIKQKYHAGDILNITLPREVSFLNKPSLIKLLDSIPDKTSVVINAVDTDYIDYDSLEVIKDFTQVRAKLHRIKVSTLGFKSYYNIENRFQVTATVTKDIQKNLTPQRVLELLKDGNKRFLNNTRLNHDFRMQISQTSQTQNPIAVILSCIDSRATPDILFDLGIGYALGIRIAGNISNQDIIGSIEFGCKVLGAKLIVVLGHTACGAVSAACSGAELGNATPLIKKIGSIINDDLKHHKSADLVDIVAKINVIKTKEEIISSSEILSKMIASDEIGIVGAMYDIQTGEVKFY